MNFQMIRVISSPSISTTGVFTLILAAMGPSSLVLDRGASGRGRGPSYHGGRRAPPPGGPHPVDAPGHGEYDDALGGRRDEARELVRGGARRRGDVGLGRRGPRREQGRGVREGQDLEGVGR